MATPAAPKGSEGGGILRTLVELAQLLADASGSGAEERSAEATLDAFLYAAGIDQILEDHLDRDALGLIRGAPYLRGVAGPVGPALAGCARRAGILATALRAGTARERDLDGAHRECAGLLSELAVAVAGKSGSVAGGGGDRAAAAGGLCQRVARLPADVRARILNMPNCFHSFDQRPEDCRRLVGHFARRWPPGDRPVLVVGIRTSGSYLAPLYAAYLRRAGYPDVGWVTVRTSKPWRRVETELRSFGATRAIGLIVDDAPRTGAQFAQVAERLGGFGVEAVLAVQQLGDAPLLPERLSDIPSVVLPFDEWSVHDDLAPDAVRARLEEDLPSSGPFAGTVTRLTRRTVEVAPRGHVRAVYDVTRSDGGTAGPARESSHTLCLEGVGLGWFGREARSVADGLPGFVPPVFSVRDGLMLRTWMDDGSRITPERAGSEPRETAAAIVRYTWARRERLGYPEDRSLALVGREAAWEQASVMLRAPFRRLSPLVRPLANRVAAGMLRAPAPCAVDGNVRLGTWFDAPASATGEALVKVGFSGRSLATDGVPCCDPVSDLAMASADALARGVDLEDALLEEYGAVSGAAIDPERWLFYRLLHLHAEYESALGAAAPTGSGTGTCVERAGSFEVALHLERAMASTLRSYLEPRYFSDLEQVRSGPLCALDIDGVLETRWIDFPALDPSGALALRMLNRHGFRVVLASGRSLGELRDRCRSYRLAGVVAEYGSVVHVPLLGGGTTDGGTTRSLISAEEAGALDELRSFFAKDGSEFSGNPVFVDRAFDHSVRVHVVTPGGHRHGLARDEALDALERSGTGGLLRLVPGELQSDFVGSGVDKGVGLAALADLLGEGSGSAPLLRLAVGDSTPDLPMLELAARAFAPSNATSDAASRARRVRQRGSAAVLRAARLEIGHRSCRTCRVRMSPGSAEQAALMALLRGIACGKLGKVGLAAEAASRLAWDRALSVMSGLR